MCGELCLKREQDSSRTGAADNSACSVEVFCERAIVLNRVVEERSGTNVECSGDVLLRSDVKLSDDEKVFAIHELHELERELW